MGMGQLTHQQIHWLKALKRSSLDLSIPFTTREALDVICGSKTTESGHARKRTPSSSHELKMTLIKCKDIHRVNLRYHMGGTSKITALWVLVSEGE